MRALLAAIQGQHSAAVELSRQALEQLPADDVFLRGTALWISGSYELADSGESASSQTLDKIANLSLASGNLLIAVTALGQLAELHERRGQLHKAWALYQRVLDLAVDQHGHRLPIAGGALNGLGNLAREWNDLETAARYLLESIQLTGQWSEVGALEAYLALARVRQAQGDVYGAQAAVEMARQLAAKFDTTDLDDLLVAMVQARLWIARGELQAVQRWAEERQLHGLIPQEDGNSPPDARLRKYELIELARLLIVQDQAGEALAVLASVLPLARRRERPALLIELFTLQALALQAQADEDEAVAALERALSLAEPEGYVRIFLDQGARLIPLLQEAAARGRAPGYAHKLLAACPAVEPPPAGAQKPQGLVEALSERELEVLRLLNAHLSSTEIADRLSISPNTARFHIKNIYGKLGVHRRSEAIQRAQELQLL